MIFHPCYPLRVETVCDRTCLNLIRDRKSYSKTELVILHVERQKQIQGVDLNLVLYAQQLHKTIYFSPPAYECLTTADVSPLQSEGCADLLSPCTCLFAAIKC